VPSLSRSPISRSLSSFLSLSRISLWKLPLLWILLSGNVFLSFFGSAVFFFWGVRRPRISAEKRKVEKQRNERSRRKTFSELLLLLRLFVFGSSKVKTARRVKCAYVCVRDCVCSAIYKIQLEFIYFKWHT